MNLSNSLYPYLEKNKLHCHLEEGVIAIFEENMEKNNFRLPDDLKSHTIFFQNEKISYSKLIALMYHDSMSTSSIHKDPLIYSLTSFSSQELLDFFKILIEKNTSTDFFDNGIKSKDHHCAVIKGFQSCNVNMLTSNLMKIIVDFIQQYYSDDIVSDYFSHYFKNRKNALNDNNSFSPTTFILSTFKVEHLRKFDFFEKVKLYNDTREQSLDNIITYHGVVSHVSVDMKKIHILAMNDSRLNKKIFPILSSVSRKIFTSEIDYRDAPEFFLNIKNSNFKDVEPLKSGLHAESMKNDILFYSEKHISQEDLKNYLKFFFSTIFNNLSKQPKNQEINWLNVFSHEVILSMLKTDDTKPKKITKI